MTTKRVYFAADIEYFIIPAVGKGRTLSSRRKRKRTESPEDVETTSVLSSSTNDENGRPLVKSSLSDVCMLSVSGRDNKTIETTRRTTAGNVNTPSPQKRQRKTKQKRSSEVALQWKFDCFGITSEYTAAFADPFDQLLHDRSVAQGLSSSTAADSASSDPNVLINDRTDLGDHFGEVDEDTYSSLYGDNPHSFEWWDSPTHFLEEGNNLAWNSCDESAASTLLSLCRPGGPQFLTNGHVTCG